MAVAALTILGGMACDKRSDTPAPVISVDRTHISVGSEPQQLTVNYEITNAGSGGNRNLSVSADDEWITGIDPSTSDKISGTISFRVAQNDLLITRSATLRLSYPGAATVDIAVDQLPTPPVEAEQTLIYYFMGTSLNRFFDYNIADAKTAIEGDILGQSRVLYLRQTSRTEAVIGELRYDPAEGGCIEQQIDKVAIPESQATADDVARNLRHIIEIAPARRYGLIVAGHSTGWVRKDADGSSATFGMRPHDDMWTPAAGAETTRIFGENNVKMDIEELAEAIAGAGAKFDYILFDACFMSNIEALYDLRHAARYIIASPCEIMGRGFPYHRTLPHLMADKGRRSDLAAAAESYWLYYRDEYNGAARCGSVTLVDCAELEPLADAARTLLATASESYDAAALQTYEGQTPHTFYDFGEFCSVAATDQAALDRFEEQLSRCVIATYTLPTFYSALGSYGTYPIDEEVYSGITTSLPSERYRDAIKRTAWWKATH